MAEKYFRAVCIAVILIQFIASIVLHSELKNIERRVNGLQSNQAEIVDVLKNTTAALEKVVEVVK